MQSAGATAREGSQMPQEADAPASLQVAAAPASSGTAALPVRLNPSATAAILIVPAAGVQGAGSTSASSLPATEGSGSGGSAVAGVAATEAGAAGTAVAAPAGGGPGPRELASVRRRIDKHKVYPKIAVRNGWEGRVLVEMSLEGDGSLTAVRLLEGSGYAVLDDATIVAVRRASPSRRSPAF